ncbi:MAG TPA: phage tail protein [Thermoanaerobaculia bacterium]|nr:phage tail protein [Thermoanaerobaculia bacterium]
MLRSTFASCVAALLFAGTAAAAGPAVSKKPNAGTVGSGATTFSVKIDGVTLNHIKSCGSIGSQTEIIETSVGGTIVKVPGKTEYVNFTCTENVSSDTTLADWRHQIEAGNLSRKNGTITLLDSTLNPITTINFTNAWPSALFIDGLDATSNNVITETITIVPESLSRQ